MSKPAPIPASLLPLNDPPARRFPWASVFIWAQVIPFAALCFIVVADLEWW